MENMLRRFALLCGGDYQEAILLNHLYYEAYEHVGVNGNYTSTIYLADLSKELCVSGYALGNYFISLSEGAELIGCNFVMDYEVPDVVYEVVGMTYTVNPMKIESRLAQSLQEAEKVKTQNKRAIDLYNPGNLTVEQWITSLNVFNWRCAYCAGNYEVLEHVIPLTFPNSGTTQKNCVPACQKCNTLKGPYHPDRLPPRINRKMGDKIASVRYRLDEWLGDRAMLRQAREKRQVKIEE